jgi:hypothetical protein
MSGSHKRAPEGHLGGEEVLWRLSVADRYSSCGGVWSFVASNSVSSGRLVVLLFLDLLRDSRGHPPKRYIKRLRVKDIRTCAFSCHEREVPCSRDFLSLIHITMNTPIIVPNNVCGTLGCENHLHSTTRALIVIRLEHLDVRHPMLAYREQADEPSAFLFDIRLLI